MKITIIGGGNGGQAMAGHFGYLGHKVTLYTSNIHQLSDVRKNKGVLLKEQINDFGKVHKITDSIEEGIIGAELIMVTTVANVHADIARKMAPFVENNQVVVLNPGRTFGAFEFKKTLAKYSNKRVYIAEAQSLLYACRAENNGEVRIIGIKDRVPVAAIPSTDTDYVLSKLNVITKSFVKAENILETSLDNIGCIFHPAIVMFNAAAIERGESFYFYNDMTPAVASFIEAIDQERLNIGKKFGVDLLSVYDWIAYSYKNVKGDTLYERMMNNPAYYKIMGPSSLNSRLLTEDIPTGILPLIELAKLVKIGTPLLQSVYNIVSELLKIDFKENGRTLANLGLEDVDILGLLKQI